jgi:hypothetical protein
MDTPKFTELPNIPNGPKGCAWAVWNKIHEEQVGDGKKDMLGTLNHLTPAVVAAAAAEIKTGSRAALKYVSLNILLTPYNAKLDADSRGEKAGDWMHIHTLDSIGKSLNSRRLMQGS